ncbi:protein SHORT HYPOCOTYL IN WHITE LIGHT 1 [Euphorbia lathyris]|uniref:protein SHORT HYPOCOTYL IN WHITE LIGHT 1 n=1 Tax=Euphorbia lathyris TaxID=212925 RepID=UPI0033132171
MATATTSSPFSCTSLTFRPTISNLSLHPSPHLPFSRQSFPFHHFTTPFKAPSFIIYYTKSDGSASDHGDEIGEAFFDDNYLTDYDTDEDETESSIDLLIRFFQSMFKKVSRRAKKASRLILPSVISPQLVSFAVDGILLLGALSIVKALLEVVCTLGSTVLTAVLLLRVIWAAISYFQSSGNTFNQGRNSFGGSQPVT